MHAKTEKPVCNEAAVFELVDALRRAGFQCVIAGGFARDKFFDITPKDADIVVFGHASFTADEDDIDESYVDKLSQFIRGYCRHVTGYESDPATHPFPAAIYSDGPGQVCEFYNYHSGDDRLLWGSTLDIGADVLAYPPEGTVFSVTESFDFNLNQFAIVGEEHIPEYMGTTPMDELRLVRNDSSDDRKAYVKAKWDKLLPLIEQARNEGRLP